MSAAYVSHIVIDGKRPRNEGAPAPRRWADRWAYQPKHAVQLLAKAGRLLKGSGLVIRDWGSDDTPADKRYFIETEDGDDWDAVPDLAAFVADLEAKP